MAEQALKFDEISEGDEAPAFSHKLTRTDLVRYAGASGDFNPMHHDDVLAQQGTRVPRQPFDDGHVPDQELQRPLPDP